MAYLFFAFGNSRNLLILHTYNHRIPQCHVTQPCYKSHAAGCLKLLLLCFSDAVADMNKRNRSI